MPAHETIHLWPDGSPHNPANDRPRIEVYLPKEKSEKPVPAVVVCPGGGYGGRAGHEGAPFAELFAAQGYVGIVCHYRVSPNRHPAPMTDVCRAIRLVRSRAKEWNIDEHKVALMGFSAGGHLASTVATQPNLHVDKLDDLAEKYPARPDRVILGYPVISMLAKTHMGSVNNLLGKDATMEMRKQMSNELQVTNENPPAFIFFTWDDGAVPVEGALMFALACKEKGVKCEVHIYESGPHGVGMAGSHPRLKGWTDLMIAWMKGWK